MKKRSLLLMSLLLLGLGFSSAYMNIQHGTISLSSLSDEPGDDKDADAFQYKKGRHGLVRAHDYVVADDDGEFNALGATLFYALWALKHDRPLLERNLDFLSKNGFDYVRVLGTLGKHPFPEGHYWHNRLITTEWEDYDALIAELTDLVYDKYGMRIEWTIFGEAGDYNQDERVHLVEQFLNMSRGREHKIMHFEVANEAWQTGFERIRGLESLRELSRYMKDRTDVLVAASSGETFLRNYCTDDDPDTHDLTELNAGEVSDMVTMHFDRDTWQADGQWRPVRQPWDLVYCEGLPRLSSNNEPIGPGASNSTEEDPLKLVSAAIVTYISKMGMYVYHTEAGIRGFKDIADEPGSNAFVQMKKYLPNNLANWERQNHHWTRHPFIMYADNDADLAWYDNYAETGAVRNYGTRAGDAFVTYPMGIRNYVRLEAREKVSFCVIDPLTGAIVQRHHLEPRQSFNLGGQEAYLIKGRYNSNDDGCEQK